MQRQIILGLALTQFVVVGHAQLAGTLTGVGSDTMRELMARWVSEFTQDHSDVTYETQAGGSGTATEALIQY